MASACFRIGNGAASPTENASVLARGVITKGLAAYCTITGYLNATKAGAARIDLRGPWRRHGHRRRSRARGREARSSRRAGEAKAGGDGKQVSREPITSPSNK
jgi:sRNA-binding protein